MARRYVLPWATNGIELSGDVLEIGGGSGAMAVGVAKTYPQVRLTMTDLDDDMVATATKELASHTRVTVERADVTALTYATASFDAVTSYLMLHHVIEWRPALREVARVLKPGGRFLGYDLTTTRVARWVHAVDRSPHLLIAPHELTDALTTLGFTEIAVETSAAGHLMRFRALKPTG
ncbi:class I SAM-dependent methyltransferase [Nocardioides hungaricus]